MSIAYDRRFFSWGGGKNDGIYDIVHSTKKQRVNLFEPEKTMFLPET